MKKSLSVFFLVFLSLAGFSQQISGIVYDAKFDRPVSGANIVLAESNRGTQSGNDGDFVIKHIQPGNYMLRVSMIGYLIYEKEITVTSTENVDLPVYLQPTSISLNNDVVISAKRTMSEEFLTPEALSIIGSKALKQESARTVPEALMGTTGVFVQKTNHGGGSPFIRGLTGNQNLQMIDGIRLNNATFRYGPNQYLATVEPMSIEKIEVVRGAGSVLYGSDALGGVLQVFTKTPSYSSDGFKAGGQLETKMMSQNMEQTGRGEIILSDNNVAFICGFTAHDYDDLIAGDTLGKESPTGYHGYSFDAKLKIRLSSNQELIMAYQYDKQNDVPRYDKLIAGYSRYHFDPQIRQLGYARLISGFSNKWFRQVTITSSGMKSDETRILQKTGKTLVTNEHDLVKTYGGIVEVQSNPWKNWSFFSGLEYYYDKVESSKTETNNGVSTQKRGYYPDGSTSASVAIFTSHTFSFGLVDLNLGGRFTSYSIKSEDAEFGNVDVNPSAVIGNGSLLFKVNKNHNLILSAYSAFRAPNLNDLSSFGSFSNGIEVPNPNLKPEKSFTAELGWKARYEKFSGSVFLYRNKLTNLIERIEAQYNGQDSLDGEKVYKKANFSEAYLQGVEGELQYGFLPFLSAYGNLTYTYGQNETSDEPITRIPPLNGRLGLYFICPRGKGYWARAEWLSAAKQDRLSAGDKTDSRIPEGGTPGWNVFNIRAGWNSQHLSITAGLNNLFDKAYRTHGSGVDGYGRSFWMAVRVGF